MVIVVGHTRWKAAKSLGLKRIPVHVAEDLTPAAAKAYRLADNKSSETPWIKELLNVELGALREDGYDMALTGFSDREIEKALDTAEEGGSGKGTGDTVEGLEFKIVIDCEGEMHQAKLIGRFEKQGLKCRALIS